MALASAVPVSVRVLSLVMPSPTMPLSVENEAMVGATGAAVSMVTLSAVEASAGVAGGIGGGGGQAVGAVVSAAVVKLQAPAPLAVALPSSVGAVIDLDRGLASAVPVSVRVLSLVMPSPATPLSVENEAMLGATGAAVSMVTLSAVEAAPVLPAASVAVAVRLWAPLASAAGGIAPGAAAVGGGAAEQRGAVIDLHRGVGFRRAGQRQGIVIGDAVAHDTAVGRERGDARGNRGRRVDGDAQRGRGRAGLPATSVAVALRLWAPLASAAVVIAPGPVPSALTLPSSVGAVIDLDRGVGFRRAGQRQGIVIGDAVARPRRCRSRTRRCSGQPAPPCRW